jgi:hypothetical protein
LKYSMIYRQGLDGAAAHGANQDQFRPWGSHALESLQKILDSFVVYRIS